MSEHPYNYGQYHGQPPNSQPFLPYTQPAPSQNSHPPYYGTFQQPIPAPGNYATVNNSFQYNASSIPGLGMANSQPPVPLRLDNNATWHPQLQTAPYHPVPVQTAQKTPTAVSKQKEPPKVSHIQTEDTLEEGELSEGEFEDLYEPKHSVGVTVPGPPSPRPPSVTENQNGSVGDADGSSIYDGATPQGEVMNSTSTSLPAAEQEYSQDEDWEPTYQEREKSGSYSPYLSPREIQRKVSVSKPTSQGTKQIPPTQHSLQPLPGITMVPAQHPTVDAPQSNGAQSVSTKGPPPGPPFRSVAEAKKKAQEAILGLWPLKVRYQDYIEEGFDEKLIKGLFTDLGLEASMPKPAAVHKPTADLEASTTTSEPSKAIPGPQDAKDEPSTTSKPKQPTTVSSTANTSPIGDAKTAAMTAAEERKDKIARKLAAKAQKTVASVQPSVPTPPSQPTPANVSITTSSSVSPAKAKTRAENNAILHQKLAALKKQQEEKAAAEKKQASENSSKPATTQITPSKNSVTIPGVSVVQNNRESSANLPTSTVPALEPTRRSVSTEKSLPRDSSIPGLFLVTQPAQPANRNLKRPVASDFDNYSSPAGTLKRTRTQETLIIDVSDDEDVEMDIGSPTDEPNSSNEIIHQPSRQNPLGTFPPLSDSPNWKQRSSPSSSVPTPPVHGAKLDLLNKRIEEAKRRIAEAEAKKAEAKKAVKRADVSQSPQAQPLPTESSTLPKVSGGSQAVQESKNGNVERRDRIVSVELPTLEAALREKQEKLKEAMAQAEQLQQEIQASLARRHKLTSEVQRLLDSVQLSTEMSEQAHNSPSETPSHSNRVTESQLPNGQQPSPEETVDVPMAEVEDSDDRDQGTLSNGVQLNSASSQSNLLADDQPFAGPAQSSQNLTPAENENNDAPPESSSTDATTDQGTANSDAIPDAVDSQNEERDQVNDDILEQRPRDPSLQIDGSQETQPTPPSLTHDAPTSGLENDVPRPLSPQDHSNSVVGESSANEVLNDTDPTQPTQELISSAPENSTGEVQNSSSHEHPLLTSTQDEPGKGLQLEDLLSYRSPLGYFRAFRFHPKYFDEVAGGLKSMTYSSRIDPMRPVCPYALSGEQCPDGNNCEFQHFESMVLPGES
ncbi:hypothetical protein M434DRAFT_393780 [Hypoxylon sp. CO27-5]|nr:hypothetical protein M434DRAFT_393780 [Hypoxylon sp. CO27-5]